MKALIIFGIVVLALVGGMIGSEYYFNHSAPPISDYPYEVVTTDGTFITKQLPTSSPYTLNDYWSQGDTRWGYHTEPIIISGFVVKERK